MINMLIDDSLGFTFLIDDLVGYYFDGTVGTIHFAYTATIAAMKVIFIMQQDNFTFEPFGHFQGRPVLGILLRDNAPGPDKVPSGHHESSPQVAQAVEYAFKVFCECTHQFLCDII